jgi:hypothetical protein
MKVIKQIDKETRVVFKWSFKTGARSLFLQRKPKRRWRDVSWMYPSIMVHNNRDLDYVVDWLLWKEDKDLSKPKTEKEAMRRLLATKPKA